jgi:hypothetical protein
MGMDEYQNVPPIYEESKKPPENNLKIFTIIIIIIVITTMISVIVMYSFVISPRSREDRELLSTDSPDMETYPEQITEFPFEVYNPTTVSYKYNLSVTGLPEEWIVHSPQTFILSGESTRLDSISVRPTLPLALNGTYPFILNVSSENINLSYEIGFNLTICQTFDLQMLCYNNTHLAEPGRSTSYAVALNNRGNGYEEVELSHNALPNNWVISYENESLSIPPFGSQVVIIDLSIDSESEEMEYDIEITATSSNGETNSVWLKTQVTSDISEKTIKIGDKIQTDYTGINPNCTIFVTSLEEIALDDDLPKSDDFSLRQVYSPLKMVVGENDPEQRDEYSLVIEGYWEAVIGLKANETTVVRVPPEKAYYDNRTMIFEITIVSIDN